MPQRFSPVTGKPGFSSDYSPSPFLRPRLPLTTTSVFIMVWPTHPISRQLVTFWYKGTGHRCSRYSLFGTHHSLDTHTRTHTHTHTHIYRYMGRYSIYDSIISRTSMIFKSNVTSPSKTLSLDENGVKCLYPSNQASRYHILYLVSRIKYTVVIF